ncbi:MAG: tRNA pseudouridine(38-40) synthase TruA [Thermovirgaceae bacterium]|nr:tRNA pseudouridine(38-40) synthase TruA [Thermovirgaceae bacterium]
MRYAARIAYDGSGFSGWQRQKGIMGETLQESLERALCLLNKSETPVVAAGRTDGGVHAMGQVVSFDTTAEWEPSKLRSAIDANLPHSISVLSVARVPETFSARHSALWREYVYFIWKGPGCPPQIRPFVWRNSLPWDDMAVRDVCRSLKGRHNFSAFCRKNDRPENTIRTIMNAGFSRKGPLYRIRVRGKSFLTNMMRIILGSVDLAVSGKRDVSWFESLLEGGTRCEAGPTAPASGLFLWKVGYDPSPGVNLEGNASYKI